MIRLALLLQTTRWNYETPFRFYTFTMFIRQSLCGSSGFGRLSDNTVALCSVNANILVHFYTGRAKIVHIRCVYDSNVSIYILPSGEPRDIFRSSFVPRLWNCMSQRWLMVRHHNATTASFQVEPTISFWHTRDQGT